VWNKEVGLVVYNIITYDMYFYFIKYITMPTRTYFDTRDRFEQLDRNDEILRKETSEKKMQEKSAESLKDNLLIPGKNDIKKNEGQE